MTEKEINDGTPPLSSPEPQLKKEEFGEEANATPSTASIDEKRRFAQARDNAFARRCWNFVTWTPTRCRWDPDDPPKFSMALNLLFGFVSADFPSTLLLDS